MAVLLANCCARRSGRSYDGSFIRGLDLGGLYCCSVVVQERIL